MGHREGSGREAGAERITPSPDDCFHLTLEIVREIHAEAIAQFGGLNGVRDENLLASAVLAPQSTFGGKSPFADLVEIAGAYLCYLSGNQPAPDSEKWEKLVLGVAAGELDRDQTTRRLRQLLKKLPRKKK